MHLCVFQHFPRFVSAANSILFLKAFMAVPETIHAHPGQGFSSLVALGLGRVYMIAGLLLTLSLCDFRFSIVEARC